MNLLLVEPSFPVADKSKNHCHFLPIGLLKIGSYHQQHGDSVQLARGLTTPKFAPDKVLVTSLFTYWSKYVHEAASIYHKVYPRARIEIGGIYASLLPDHCKVHSPFASIKPGLYRGGAAEAIPIDYSLLPEDLDYQILHASRGCPRRCAFCGTWRIEPEVTNKRSVVEEIRKPRVVFYDNNLLANPFIDDILEELAGYRMPDGRRVICESQSGFDLDYLTETRAKLLKCARFAKPRIAWDGPYAGWAKIREAVRVLKRVGYGRKDIFVFMIYNYELPYAEMRRKLDACRRWRVRVIDCRYRPLDSTEDNYRPGPREQTSGAYYVHPGWTDRQVRTFRRAVRHQNIAILLNLPHGRYIQGCEQRMVPVPPR